MEWSNYDIFGELVTVALERGANEDWTAARDFLRERAVVVASDAACMPRDREYSVVLDGEVIASRRTVGYARLADGWEPAAALIVPVVHSLVDKVIEAR